MSTTVERKGLTAPREFKIGEVLRLTLFDMLVISMAVVLLASIG